MTPTLAEYVEAGYALTPEERLTAARMLRSSVDQDTTAHPTDVASEWEAVIERRVTDIVSGRVEAVDGPQSFTRIRARLDEPHS